MYSGCIGDGILKECCSLSLIQKGIVLPLCMVVMSKRWVQRTKAEVVHNVTCFRSDTCFGQAGGSTLPIGVAMAFLNFLVIGWGFSNVKFHTNPGCDRFLKPVRVINAPQNVEECCRQYEH